MIVANECFDTSFEKVEQMVGEAINVLVEIGRKKMDEVLKEYTPLLEDLVKNLTGEMKGIAFGKEVDMLDMPTLVKIAKQYIVPKSNETIALKVQQGDCYFIYLAYSKDRQLLPSSDNKYVIIKAQALEKEVDELFSNSELIILK